MKKPAPVDHPVLSAIQHRWSSRALSDKPIEESVLHSLFEAARWAPSASNVQPWRFVYVTKDDGEVRTGVESALMEGNSWAKNASVLIVGFAEVKRKNADGQMDDHYYGMYDTGAASAYLVLQAAELGLIARQMGGFDHTRVREVLDVPEEFAPASIIALGYPSSTHDHLVGRHQEMEKAPRARKVQNEFVFHPSWPALNG